METKLIAFGFCCLMAVAHSSPHVRPSMDLEEEIYDLSPDEADNFFRFLLLSKYGLDSSDYPAADQLLSDEETEEMPIMSFGDDGKPMRFDEKPMRFDGKPTRFDEKPTRFDDKPMSFDDKPMSFDDKPMSFDVDEKPISFDVKGNPMEFDADEKMLPFDTDEMPYGSEGFSIDDSKLGNSMHPFRQAIQKLKEEHSTTTATPAAAPKVVTSSIDPSPTTSEPDVLASMPPVLSKSQGQKEFVMLRPPTDNHRKIEHLMEEMANDLGMQAPITMHKKRFAM